MTIDFQGLLNVLHAAENEPNFYMGTWRLQTITCGTSHCMVGAFCDQNREDELRLANDNEDTYPTYKGLEYSEAIAARFGITNLEAEWLFIGLLKRFSHDWMNATSLTKPEALARLRKFIYYKLHKQEMEYETARRIPGRKSAVLAGMA